jgi:hypothetical protein
MALTPAPTVLSQLRGHLCTLMSQWTLANHCTEASEHLSLCAALNAVMVLWYVHAYMLCTCPNKQSGSSWYAKVFTVNHSKQGA